MANKKNLMAFALPIVKWYWRVRRPKTHGVKVLIFHPAKPEDMLLVRHAYGDRSLWNIPGGGYKPKKESAYQAAQREVAEELGVRVRDLVRIGEYETSGEGKCDTVAIFRGTIEDPDAIMASAEIAQWVWQQYESVKGRADVARVVKRAIECAHL